MTCCIYALLVGIDEYPNPVPSLNGCVNDILAFKAYLEGRMMTDDFHLNLHTLINQQATRQAIIDGFRQHLGQAKSEDVVLFYYAGHGSQEQAPPEFWSLEPDRLNETLVCYDSRSPGGWDLADKELAQLIAEVSEKNPHITIILDCCNSGSGTRGDLIQEVAVRKAPLDYRQRPLESYIFSLKEAVELSNSRSLEANPSGWKLHKGRHVFLAACRDIELAKEYNSDGQTRGAFSYFLLDTLQKTNGNLTYRDAFKRANALVRAKVAAQSPQLEATVASDLEQIFLSGAMAERTDYFTVSYHRNYGWIVDAGLLRGIPQPIRGETTLLALFPFESSAEQLHQSSAAVATAEAVEVLPQLSRIKIRELDNLDSKMTFKAVISSLPVPPKGVLFEGEATGIELARAALQTASPQQQPSLYIREVNMGEAAEFKLIAQAGTYLIARPTDDRPLVAPILGYTPATAFQAILRLEHIARWTNIAELSSPAMSRIRADAVRMSIYQNEEELQSTDIRLEYSREGSRWRQPSFKVKLENTSREPLYCALLDLSDRFAVSAGFFPTGGVWLAPGESAWAVEGESIYPVVPNRLWEQGITEVRDLLKLIVSTAEFDATLLEQEELDLPFAGRGLTNQRRGTLNRLMYQIQSRDLRFKPEEEEYDDWVSTQVTITTVRPRDTTPIESNRNIFLGAGVEVQAHPRLKAAASLTTVTQSVRDLGTQILPPLLRLDQVGVQMLQFTTSRGSDPGLSALELTDVQDPAVVTPDEPLHLKLNTTLQPDEALVPIAYDGEFFLPLGRCYSTLEGKTAVRIERLPTPVSQGQRSLGGSIRIFFHKVLSQKLGLEFEYPQLAIAQIDADETVSYQADIEQVKAKVASAERIVLFIHGIIGDTMSLVPSLRKAKVMGDSERTLNDLYDLVLTFDYENLNTSIEENARLLKQRLTAVGLVANHGKVLHIVAHSMGGLVSRWFIEREGGNQQVQHLILLGTPNAGSPWATVEDWALTALSMGLNGLTQIKWPPPVVGMLIRAVNGAVKGLEAIDISLDQMHPESEFLKTLAASPDPGIPYTIIAGNTSIIPAAFASSNQSNPLERLMQRLFNKTVALPFFEQPNDIAVTVRSIQSVSGERMPQPRVLEIGCDHLVYFSHPTGLETLSHVLTELAGESAGNRSISHTPRSSIPDSPDNKNKDLPVNRKNLGESEISGKDSSSTKRWLFSGLAICILAGISIFGWLFFQSAQKPEPNRQEQTRQ